MDMTQIQQYLAIAGAVAIAIPALLSAALGIALVVPGDQPDKALEAALAWSEKAVDFIKGFSRKP